MIELLLLATSVLVTVLVLRAFGLSPLARYFGDVPDHRKVHQSVVPRFGGIGMILSFLAILGLQALVPFPPWAKPDASLMSALLLIGIAVLLAGGLDDLKPISYKLKFLFQFALALGIVVLLEMEFDVIAFMGYRLELGYLGPILSILWFVALMNALNIIDGIDGLAAGVSLCGFGAVALMSHFNQDYQILMLCMTLMGLTLGFLRFNFSRKHKLFLGDAGSQFLGAMLALCALEVQGMPKTGFSFFVPLFIVGYPLLDITVAMVRRFKCGHRFGFKGRFLRMFAADNEHLHHRLVYLGLSHVQSTFLLLLVAGGIGATAIIIHRVDWPLRPLVMGYLAAALLLILNRLGYMGRSPWLTFPRAKTNPSSIVGVIEPDEVFMHSLNSFKQDRFTFLSIPSKLTQFMTDDLVAVLLYNATSSKFDEEWIKALRATEIQDCQAVVIAESHDITKVKALNPIGYRSVHFVEKPVRIPDLIRLLESISVPPAKAKRARDRAFSLAELALRSRKNAGS